MMRHMTESEARAALLAVDDRRRQVMNEINMPRWYWWSVAAGWVVIGLLTDFASAWASGIATFAFGAGHAALAPRALSGRHRTGQLSVHRDLVSRWLPLAVLGGLVAMVGVTLALALALSADGAEHPVTIASVFVGLIIVLGGPHLIAVIRGRAMRAGREA